MQRNILILALYQEVQYYFINRNQSCSKKLPVYSRGQYNVHVLFSQNDGFTFTTISVLSFIVRLTTINGTTSTWSLNSFETVTPWFQNGQCMVSKQSLNSFETVVEWFRNSRKWASKKCEISTCFHHEREAVQFLIHQATDSRQFMAQLVKMLYPLPLVITIHKYVL